MRAITLREESAVVAEGWGDEGEQEGPEAGKEDIGDSQKRQGQERIPAVAAERAEEEAGPLMKRI